MCRKILPYIQQVNVSLQHILIEFIIAGTIYLKYIYIHVVKYIVADISYLKWTAQPSVLNYQALMDIVGRYRGRHLHVQKMRNV